jgi:hypothetical protein
LGSGWVKQRRRNQGQCKGCSQAGSNAAGAQSEAMEVKHVD